MPSLLHFFDYNVLRSSLLLQNAMSTSIRSAVPSSSGNTIDSEATSDFCSLDDVALSKLEALYLARTTALGAHSRNALSRDSDGSSCHGINDLPTAKS